MSTFINLSQVFVLDQDEALAFYVDKLGLEVHTDADLGFMRWLTVIVPGDPSHQILLSGKGHGVDFGVRDPFGNKLRIGRLHAT